MNRTILAASVLLALAAAVPAFAGSTTMPVKDGNSTAHNFDITTDGSGNYVPWGVLCDASAAGSCATVSGGNLLVNPRDSAGGDVSDSVNHALKTETLSACSLPRTFKPINTGASMTEYLVASGVAAKQINICTANLGPVGAAVGVAPVEGTAVAAPTANGAFSTTATAGPAQQWYCYETTYISTGNGQTLPTAATCSESTGADEVSVASPAASAPPGVASWALYLCGTGSTTTTSCTGYTLQQSGIAIGTAWTSGTSLSTTGSAPPAANTAQCDVNMAGLIGGTTAATGWQFPIGGGTDMVGNGDAVMKTATTGDNVCLVIGTPVQVPGVMSYVIQ